ncbi:hypothetical protein H1C71_025632 [Ictidomys tridecemlineatus]|nr:hypothetical protein H1C71_025632 [Ictidomys tridecemlineatus]
MSPPGRHRGRRKNFLASWVFAVASDGRVGMAEKQSHRLQSITPPASPSLPGGNLQGPSGFEGRGQEETLNSGSTEDKERLPCILFLLGFSSSASYSPSPQNKLISLSTTKGNGTRTQRDVYQPLCAEPHLSDAERRAPLPERQLSADCWSRRFHSLRTDEGTKDLYAAHLPEESSVLGPAKDVMKSLTQFLKSFILPPSYIHICCAMSLTGVLALRV